MISVVGQIKSSFALYSALLITLITRVKANDHCASAQLDRCTGTLKHLTGSGLTFVSSKADLDSICPDLKQAIKCIHQYTRSCMPLNRHKHFEKLFRGTGHMVHELCANGTYQQEYLKHAPCMKSVANENEVCVTRYARAMKEIQSQPDVQAEVEQAAGTLKKRREVADVRLKSVCCSFQEYIQCSTRTMGRACGEEAAEFSRAFLDRMSNTMMESYCKAYGPMECGFPSSAKELSYSLLVLITASISTLLLS